VRQLPLGVELGVSLRFDTFVAGRNAGAIEALRCLAGGALRAPVWIYGPPGSGKSHLLQAACADAGSAGRATAWLPLGTVKDDGPAILDGFEGLDLVALDDLDAVAGLDAWEAGLFTLFNGIAERGGALAFAAATAPAATPVRLPDLASRLAAAPAVAVRAPDDTLMAAVLIKLFEDRQIAVGQDVVDFLLLRLERSFAAARALVAASDEAALAARRRITIPLVREVLGRLDAPGE
jgi:DnaA family protein